jgi:dTDP-glucose 4,6-dehydratase
MLKTRMETPFRSLPPSDLDHVLEHAEPAWQALRGARLFITGGTGFVGTWLLESIAAANARLGAGISATVLSRSPENFRARVPHIASLASIEWLRGDVRDFAFPPGSWSHVVHSATAASAALNSERPREMFETIVDGTRRALDFASERGANDFLFVSSGGVYGRQPSDLALVPETFSGAPDSTSAASAYHEGKRTAETLCAIAARDTRLRPKIARGFAFVGPHLPLDAHFAAGNFLRDALQGQQIVVQGDGTPVRSYLHASDMVVWLLTILVKGERLRPYNVGSDAAVSLQELAQLVAGLPAERLRVQVRGAPSGAPPERYVPSVERARRELGLEVRIGLDDAFRRTWHWLRGEAR